MSKTVAPPLPPIEIVALDQAVSTNDEAFVFLSSKPACLVWTLDQTGGRGSKGRSWVTPPGCGLAMTLGLNTDAAPAPSDMNYPLLAGALLWETLREWTGDAPLSLKWPNDALLGGRKLAGILCESRWAAGSRPRLAIGVGVNLRRHPQLEALPRDWASLDETSQPPTAAQIVDGVARRFPALLRRFGDQEALRAAWLSHSAHRPGARLRVRAENRTLEGVFAGLDQDGSLLVRDGGGAVHAIRQSCQDFTLLDSPGV